DVHRIDALGAVLQQAVGETARRGADVQSHGTFRKPAECVQGPLQLDTPAANVPARLPPHFDGRRLRHHGARLLRLAALHVDEAGHDGGRRFLPAREQPPLYQQHVQSPARRAHAEFPRFFPLRRRRRLLLNCRPVTRLMKCNTLPAASTISVRRSNANTFPYALPPTDKAAASATTSVDKSASFKPGWLLAIRNTMVAPMAPLSVPTMSPTMSSVTLATWS